MISKQQEETIENMRKLADLVVTNAETLSKLFHQSADAMAVCFQAMDELDIRKTEIIDQQAALIAELTGRHRSASDVDTDGEEWKQS